VVSHRSLLYQAKDSSRRVAHQSPPLDGDRQVSLINHFRMQIVQEQRDHPTRGGDLGSYGRTGVVVRGGPGMGSHTGKRVRDRQHKTASESGLQSDLKINEIVLNHTFTILPFW